MTAPLVSRLEYRVPQWYVPCVLRRVQDVLDRALLEMPDWSASPSDPILHLSVYMAARTLHPETSDAP